MLAGAELLEQDFGVPADVWSTTSLAVLTVREAHAVVRWNMLHPLEPPRVPYATAQLHARRHAVVVDGLYEALLRPDPAVRAGHLRARHRRLRPLRQAASCARTEVDRHYVAVAALKALSDENKVPSIKVAEAIKRYRIDPDKPNPATT